MICEWHVVNNAINVIHKRERHNADKHSCLIKTFSCHKQKVLIIQMYVANILIEQICISEFNLICLFIRILKPYISYVEYDTHRA